MMPFSIYLALKYLRPKRSCISVVTFISVLGVVLGVAILVIVLSVMAGFDEMWCDKVLSFKPHLTVTCRYGVVEDGDALCGRVEKIKGVTGAAPVVEARAMISCNRVPPRAPCIIGVSPGRASRVSRIAACIKCGKFTVEENQAVLGVDLAREMKLDVGSVFQVYSPRNVTANGEICPPADLAVAGIFDMGKSDFDDGVVLTSLEVGRALVGLKGGCHAVYVMTNDPFRFDEFAERIREALGPAYAVGTWREGDSLMFAALSHYKTVMFILLVFITIVAIFCVTNTLIVITVQKTNEIGLLKALGFSVWQIMGAFVWLGWIQCFVGVVSGIGVGLLVLVNLKNIVRLLAAVGVEVFPKKIYFFSEIPWSTSCAELVNVAVFVLVFCTCASILPAWRAAQMNPVVALRQKVRGG